METNSPKRFGPTTKSANRLVFHIWGESHFPWNEAFVLFQRCTVASLHSIPDVHTWLQWLDTYAQRRCQTTGYWCSWKDEFCFALNLLMYQYTMMLRKQSIFLPPNICQISLSDGHLCVPPKRDYWRKGTLNYNCLALLQGEVDTWFLLAFLNYCSFPPHNEHHSFPIRIWDMASFIG